MFKLTREIRGKVNALKYRHTGLTASGLLLQLQVRGITNALTDLDLKGLFFSVDYKPKD